ncbi:MAG: MlaA family lipoprotein, partial [Gammaproteobacteria bacterium]
MKFLKTGLVLALIVLVGGCAHIPPHEDALDPLIKANRVSYALNDGLDRAVLKPAAKGYRRAVSSPVKQGVRNFFNNLGEP